MDSLLKRIRACQICVKHLPLKPKPILNFSRNAKIMIIGQAPGIKAHDSGKPWNDASGIRLREWLGVTDSQFYDPSLFAIVPMGFCYPGKGKSGDLPPRPECAEKWMNEVIDYLKKIELTVLIGAYSQSYFLNKGAGDLTETVKNWKAIAPKMFPLPHPSPRNNIWLAKNPWFEKNLVPQLKKSIQRFL